MIYTIFFSFILLFGAITSYEDVREGKIRNMNILLALLFAALINILVFSGFIGNLDFSQGYYLDLFINVVIAFLVGFSLWIFNLWTPGDAKLFTAYAALVPLTTYKLGYVRYFPSFIFLSNTFVPLFFLMLMIIPFSIKKSDKQLTKTLLNPKKFVDRIIFLFGFLWFFNTLFSFLGINLTLLMYLLLFITIPYIFRKIRIISLTWASIILAVLRMIFDFNTVFTIDFLGFFILLILVFTIVMSIIGLGGFIATTTSVKIKDLTPGMIPAEKIKSDNGIISNAGRGITSDEIKLLNKLYDGGKLKKDHVDIQQSLPFAPFLFFGVLLTFFCEGDLIAYLKILLKI